MNLIRIIAISIVCIAYSPNSVWADTKVLTEEDVVEMVRGRPDIKGALAGKLEAARAEIDGASTFDNLEVSYEREQLFGGDSDETENTAALSKTFDISGSRRLNVNSAKFGLKAAELEGEEWLLGMEQDVRLLFYRVLHAQQQTAALSSWIERLEHTVEEVRSRSDAGDVSGYDLLRLSRELSLAQADLVQSEAHGEHLWKILEARIGGQKNESAVRPQLEGELVPGSLPGDSSEFVSLAKNNLGQQAREARSEAARFEAKAASRKWVPPISLSAGYKTAEAGGQRAHGFVFGVSAPLPIFDRGQGPRRASEANSRIADATLELSKSHLEGEVNGLIVEGQKLLVAAKDLRGDIEETSGKLLETAEVAYRGGELSVVELIDAYNNHIEAELGALNLELLARETRIELGRLIGGKSK